MVAVFLFVWAGWRTDAGAAPQAPEQVHARSGPQRIFVEWAPSPDYDLIGYEVWRTRLDMEGEGEPQPVAAPELVQAGWRTNEWQTDELDRPLPEWPHYYQVQAVDLSGGKSALSPRSEIVEPGTVTLFMPNIRINTQEKSDLYLTMRSDVSSNPFSVVRFPFAVDCAYGLRTNGFGVVVEYPSSLLYGSEGLSLGSSGVTAGLPLAYDLSMAGEVRIESEAVQGRDLYGAGVLFNAYIPMPAFTADTGVAVCSFLSESEDIAGIGTRFFDEKGNTVRLALRDGSCQALSSAALNGDANGDGTIDAKDPLRILEALNGEGEAVGGAHDINLDGLVDAADASMIQRWIDKLDIELPAPTKADPWISKAYADAEGEFHPGVSIEALKGNPGDTVEVSLSIDSGTEPANLAGFSVVLSYPVGDDAVVEAIADPGDALPAGVVFNQNNEVNGGHGALHLSASMKEGLAVGGVQTLAVISFTLGASAPSNTSYPVTIQSFESNDQYGHTPRHGAPGQVAKSGIITGAVIASLLSAKDGSPIDTASVRLETLGRIGEPSEDNSGLYAFPGVPDGSYTLQATAQGFLDAQTSVTVANAEIVSKTISMKLPSVPEGEEEGEEEGEGEGEKPCKGILRCGPAETPSGGLWGDGLMLALVLGVLVVGLRRGRPGAEKI